MARQEYSSEEVARFIEVYNTTYSKNIEKRRKMLERAHGGLTREDQRDILDLEIRRYEDYQVVPSIRAYIREVRQAQRKRYEEALDSWDPKSNRPKPKMPKQDSFIRYAAGLANRDTRTISVLQANAILTEGNFKVPVEKFNKRTGEVTTKYRKITRDELYYLSEDDLDRLVWDKIRSRRKELIEENKRKGGEGLMGKLLSEYLATTIAREFFGSD